MSKIETQMTFSELRKFIKKKWPDASYSKGFDSAFRTGIENLDSLFPQNGIPFGQLIEITGRTSSGKTSFLLQILSEFTKERNVAYLDFSKSFFPSAAEFSGVDITRVFVVNTDNLNEGLRAAELILRHRIAFCIVLDLVNVEGRLPIAIMHRLRQDVLKAGSIMIFLTENSSSLIPESMIALRLEVERKGRSNYMIAVTKGRNCNVGAVINMVI